jgi:hypothetical protein
VRWASNVLQRRTAASSRVLNGSRSAGSTARTSSVVRSVTRSRTSISRRSPGARVRLRVVLNCGRRMWSSRSSRTSMVRFGCVSSDGNATSLSNTVTAVARLGDRRAPSTRPCSSTLMIRRSAATGWTIRIRFSSSSASSLLRSAPKPPVWISTSSPSARTRSTTNRPTGTSRRSPGSASSAFTAA